MAACLSRLHVHYLQQFGRCRGETGCRAKYAQLGATLLEPQSWWPLTGTAPCAGMLLSNQFPINYFSVSEVEQWYPDLADLWSKTEHGLPDAGKFWRFNKIHDYGGCPEFCLCFCVPCIVDTCGGISCRLERRGS